MTSPLLALPGAVPGEHADAAVPAHHGDPLAEQRAMDRRAAVVDRSHRGVIAVAGEERLSWLHLLLTQHVAELPANSGTEALVLDANGRVEHHAVLSQVDATVYLDVEPGTVGPFLDYLSRMVFWSKAEPRDATDEFAVLSLVGPETPQVLDKVGITLGERPYDSASVRGAIVRRMPWPGRDAADLLVPRPHLTDWWQRLRGAGAAAAGHSAFEAFRIAALRPRLKTDTDERTIPHEVGWIGPAVHLTKGCYRGQETVARVANLGQPPRRLVVLHTDGGDEELPAPGDPVRLGTRTVGRVGTAALHHELGGVALALVKRSVPVDAELTAGDGDRVSPVRIDPDSLPLSAAADGDEDRPGRAAQLRTGRIRPR